MMDALDELVRTGKVRILGCSNETSWGLMKSLAASEKLGGARYHTIQNNFSLNNRRFEDELAQVCRQEGVSLIRSEEHTSELQSLMRISYAVFCLKKKNNTNVNNLLMFNMRILYYNAYTSEYKLLK